MRVLTVVVLLAAVGQVNGAVLTRNAAGNANVAAELAAWLTDVGIAEAEVQYFVDFEAGFADGQNISGVAGAVPGGLVIDDTTVGNSATIRGTTAFFGGSNPVGSWAVAHNEGAYLALDFSTQPVDYFSFWDIDHSGTTIVVTFVGGGTFNTSIETTAAGGNSAEFWGIFHNDMPQITRIELDASGDSEWGIDNLRYGVVGEPCVLGDTDGDGDVDFDDFLAVQNFFGDGGPDSPGDADCDGDSDFDDFLAVNNFFGFVGPPGVAFVPEPGTGLLMMGVSGVVLAGRRR